MNVPAVWPQLRSRFSRASAARRDGLRRVTLRLAAQTVGLLLVMLIVLEIVVYLITQQSLVGALEDTLKTRANQPDPTVCAALNLHCPGVGFGPGGGPGQAQGNGSPPPNGQQGTGGSGFTGTSADT